MSLLYTNNAVSTLAAAAAIGATSLTLATGQGARFPVITPGNTFLLTLANIVGGVEVSWEIVEVTARAADVLTVVRAREGTAAQAWPVGAPIEQRLTAGTLQALDKPGIASFAYNNRAILRTTPGIGFAYVEGIGLFQWVAASVEPDDDETAFAATGGVWELAATDPDYVFAEHILRFDALQRQIAAVVAAAAAAKALYATFSMTATALINQAEVEFTVPVPNAAAGDSVLVTPSDNWNLNNPELTFFGYVSSAGNVKVAIKCGGFKSTYLNTQSEYVGPQSSTMTPGTWSVAVFKP